MVQFFRVTTASIFRVEEWRLSPTLNMATAGFSKCWSLSTKQNGVTSQKKVMPKSTGVTASKLQINKKKIELLCTAINLRRAKSLILNSHSAGRDVPCLWWRPTTNYWAQDLATRQDSVAVKFFVAFFTQSLNLRKCYGITGTFQFVSHSAVTNHPIALHYMPVIQACDSVTKQTTNNKNK